MWSRMPVPEKVALGAFRQCAWPWGSGVRLLMFAVLLAPLAACATKGDVRSLREDMRAVADRQEDLLAELERLQWVTQDSLRAQSRMLTTLRGELSQRILDVHDQVIELQALTGQSQQVLAGLRDQVEAQRRQVAQPPQAAPWDFQAGDMPPEGSPEDAAAAREIYNQAVNQFNRGNLGTARRAFEDFIERFPNHQLSPEARYFLADIMVQEGEPRRAIDAFLRIQELHPTAPRVAQALYRVGVLYIEEEEYALAETYLERVINTYPDSEAAELAEERLREIR